MKSAVKYLKRALALVLVLLTLVGMTACGGEEKKTEEKPTGSATEAVEAEVQSGSRTPMSAPELAEYVKVRTVTVYVEGRDFKGNGTGFFIDDQGSIVTSYHVIDGADVIEVSVNQNGSYATYEATEIVDFNPVYDVAVLKINIKDSPYLNFSKEDVILGDDIYAVGSSKGLEGTFTFGKVSTVSRILGKIDCIQHDASISSGSSGGPLVNQYGEVVGINAYSQSKGNDLNFAVNISNLDVLDMDKNWNIDMFREWYAQEIHSSYRLYDALNDKYVYSRINTYHDYTGAECKFSYQTADGRRRVKGYQEANAMFEYDFDKEQFKAYTTYLREIGFVYEGEISEEDRTLYTYVDSFNGHTANFLVESGVIKVFFHFS